MVFRLPRDEPSLLGFMDAARRNSLLQPTSMGKQARCLCLTVPDRGNRALRGKAKIKARLIGDCDPDEWYLPPKPKWMRWRTYNRYVQKFDAYEDILNENVAALMARFRDES